MSRDFTEVAGGVHVASSQMYSTNSTVLVSGRAAVLVDPSWLPDELQEIANWLDERALTVVAGFSTHAHHDHLLWHPRFGTAPRFASPRVAEIAAGLRVELTDALGPTWPGELRELVGEVQPSTSNRLAWDGFPIELITHDAHAPGHTALWLPEQKALLAGDLLSDLELPLAEETGLADYVEGLKALAPFVSRARVLVPGHGNPARNAKEPGSVAARLHADQTYLQDLLISGDSDDARISLPDMAAAHAHNRSLAAKLRQ